MFTSHPCLPEVTDTFVREYAREWCDGDVGRAGAAIETKRRTMIAQAAADPLRHGFELECWRAADRLLAQPETRLVANLGGGGSSKTTWAVKRGVHYAFTTPRSKVLFLHEDEDASRDVHQAMAYDFLPPEVKPVDTFKPKATVSTQIIYNAKGGFSDNAFTTPIGGKVRFGFYRQDITRWEGTGWSLIVFDENAPLEWIETLLYRLGRSGGKAIWCFTAINGITPAVAEITRGARTLESRPIPPEEHHVLPHPHRCADDQDWPVGHMPYVQQAVRPEVKIIYFHSSMNQLSGYDPAAGRAAGYGYRDQIMLCVGKPRAVAERRLYGYTRKSSRTLFPSFGAAHVVPHARMMERLAATPHTRYHIVDPAGRNFFMIWFAVDAHGRHYLYREWPDVPTYGEWAVPSKNPRKWNGDRGPAQESLGLGVVEYKRLIAELEKAGEREPEEIFERFIDPRSGATEAMASDAGESSLIDRFRQEQHDSAGRLIGPSMEFTPAKSGKREEAGILEINELLAYDLEQPITALLNEPHLYVSDQCQSTIWALQNYAGRGHEDAASKDEACKDPVDCVRYMAIKECRHIDRRQLAGVVGGGW
jgi:hypothetical protein